MDIASYIEGTLKTLTRYVLDVYDAMQWDTLKRCFLVKLEDIIFIKTQININRLRK